MADTISPTAAWIRQGLPFLDYIDRWLTSLPAMPLEEAIQPAAATAIACVDVVNGFCHQGPLASRRVASIIPPIVDLFQRAWGAGVRHFLLPQDAHDPHAAEFAQFPPHCVRGTAEADSVPELRALPFYDKMVVIEKNSIHAGLHTALSAWVDSHPDVRRFIVVGDCTDLCTYQLAMHLRLDANARQVERRVLLPVNAVETYDLPTAAAADSGAVPHDAGVLHHVFLYSMMLNGVEVVASIE